MPAGVMLDAFSGAGGNSIAFASARGGKQQGSGRQGGGFFVLGVDIVASRLLDAKHNAAIYGRAASGRLDFLRADMKNINAILRPGVADCVFLSPPWAEKGIMPVKGQFSVARCAGGLDGRQLLKDAQRLAAHPPGMQLGRSSSAPVAAIDLQKVSCQNVALFLPRDTLEVELRRLALLANTNVLVQQHYRSVKGQLAPNATALTCYFGRWAEPENTRKRLREDPELEASAADGAVKSHKRRRL
eukprot:TRINITY_DN58722_c0_g1_i1.p1 TRINITY_DN58722_c0_g1~~TRINITY_DN58722_c0_g1_i1.p1  ORF type:complete len:244 (+),score=44.13 TRINITY_DN58722_c0_g1_i1:634-1365(+)